MTTEDPVTVTTAHNRKIFQRPWRRFAIRVVETAFSSSSLEGTRLRASNQVAHQIKSRTSKKSTGNTTHTTRGMTAGGRFSPRSTLVIAQKKSRKQGKSEGRFALRMTRWEARNIQSMGRHRQAASPEFHDISYN